jgi:dihydroorotase
LSTPALLIKNAILVDPISRTFSKSDLLIENGMITKIEQNIFTKDKELLSFDANNCWLMPGFIDIHTHLRDFGQADKEDISSGTKAAAAGGYTKVLAMANTDPPIDNTAILSLLKEKIAAKAIIDVMPAACVTKSMQGQELTNIVDLKSSGVFAFSDDGMPIANLSVFKRALEYMKLVDGLIISHAENKDLSAGGVMHDSKQATCLGLPPIPASAEAAAIASEIEVARDADGRLHFAHVSCASSVALIRQAKADGLKISCDVTPHHLTLTVDQINGYDTSFKMNPPLRTKEDQIALIEGLRDGTIDAIATDHAPHTDLEKSRPFDEAPVGVLGLETAFAVSCKLLLENGFSPLEIATLFTLKPASILRLPPPEIKTGQVANLTVFQCEQNWHYDTANGFSKSSNSPYKNNKLTGKILLTVLRDKIVFQDQGFLAN